MQRGDHRGVAKKAKWNLEPEVSREEALRADVDGFLERMFKSCKDQYELALKGCDGDQAKRTAVTEKFILSVKRSGEELRRLATGKPPPAASSSKPANGDVKHPPAKESRKVVGKTKLDAPPACGREDDDKENMRDGLTPADRWRHALMTVSDMIPEWDSKGIVVSVHDSRRSIQLTSMLRKKIQVLEDLRRAEDAHTFVMERELNKISLSETVPDRSSPSPDSDSVPQPKGD